MNHAPEILEFRRRYNQFLCGLILLVIGVAFVLNITGVYRDPVPRPDIFFLQGGYCLILWLVFARNRRRFHVADSYFLLISVNLFPLVLHLYPESYHTGFTYLYFVTLPVVAAGFLISPRASIVVTALNLVFLAVEGWLIGDVPLEPAQRETFEVALVRISLTLPVLGATTWFFTGKLTELLTGLAEKNRKLRDKAREEAFFSWLGQAVLKQKKDLALALCRHLLRYIPADGVFFLTHRSGARFWRVVHWLERGPESSIVNHEHTQSEAMAFRAGTGHRTPGPPVDFSDVLVHLVERGNEPEGLLYHLRREHRANSAIMIPTYTGRADSEILVIYSGRKKFFTPEQIQFLMTMGNILGTGRAREKAEVALRQQEVHLDSALQTGQIATWKWDVSDSSHIWCSRQFWSLMGDYQASKSEERWRPLSFRQARRMIDHRDRMKFMRAFNRAFRSRRSFLVDFRLQNMAGQLRWARIQGKISENEDGQPGLQAVGTVSDVTDIFSAQDEIHSLNQELEERVRQRTAQLEAINAELESFAYSVSHDLRAPLRGITGFTQVILQEFGETLDEKILDYLGKIEAGSTRLNQLIDGMLQLSRLSRREIQFRDTNLKNLVAAIFQRLQALHPDRSSRLEILGEHFDVLADPVLIQAALENLIDNAWKFSRFQEEVRIQFGVFRQRGEWIYFVRDFGVGFNNAYADKIFSPFQRLHSLHEFEGSGIGLASVQRIINRHGGRIWTESEEKKGAVFYFVLGNGPISDETTIKR